MKTSQQCGSYNQRMKKPVKQGLDFFRDANWQPIVGNLAGAIRLGEKRMPEYLKRFNFMVSVCDCGDYYRVNYGR